MTFRGTKQLRKGRFSERSRIYHVTSSTFERRPILTSLLAGRQIVSALQKEEAAGHAATLTYVIMPDHFHWLMQLAGHRSLGACVNAVKSGSARNINQLSGHTGRIWQKGYYDRAIRYDEDVVSVARYIVANPLRAGLVNSLHSYALWDAVWIPG